jgi:hypothetical protein
MHAMRLWAVWQGFIQSFAHCFTRPGWRRFVERVTALTLNVEEQYGSPVSDAQVELVHRAGEGATSTSLGRGVSDAGGPVRLELALGADQRDSGQLLVSVQRAEKTSGRCPTSPAGGCAPGAVTRSRRGPNHAAYGLDCECGDETFVGERYACRQRRGRTRGSRCS